MFIRMLGFLMLLLLTVNNLSANSYSYGFLRYNSGARSAAMAGAFEGVNEDASAVFYNPATIFTVSDKRFSATFLKHTLDINSGNVSYVKNYEDIGTFSVSAIYSNYGSFNSADKLGNLLGKFGANDLALCVHFANELDTNLYYGVGVKYIFSNISQYSSSAVAFDIGLLYNLEDGRTSIAASVLNAGFQLYSYDGETEKLPLDIRLGVNHSLIGLPLLIAFSFHHLGDRTDAFFDRLLNFSIGGEFHFGKYVNVRLGYDNYTRRYTAPSRERKLSGLAGGIGIKTKYFNFDYAISQVGTSNLLNRFSINFDF